MTLEQAVLLALLRLKTPWEPAASAEPPEARSARLSTIAAAIALVAEEPTPGWRWSARAKASAIVAVTDPESRHYSLEVHEGRLRGDHGKAACLGMLHQTLLVSRAEWRASMGTDLEATTVCVRGVARVLGAGARCVQRGRELDSHHIAKIFAIYGTGRTCNPELRFARDRGREWRRLDRQLERWLAPARSAYA